jgi:hypothetical protein
MVTHTDREVIEPKEVLFEAEGISQFGFCGNVIAEPKVNLCIGELNCLKANP